MFLMYVKIFSRVSLDWQFKKMVLIRDDSFTDVLKVWTPLVIFSNGQTKMMPIVTRTQTGAIPLWEEQEIEHVAESPQKAVLPKGLDLLARESVEIVEWKVKKCINLSFLWWSFYPLSLLLTFLKITIFIGLNYICYHIQIIHFILHFTVFSQVIRRGDVQIRGTDKWIFFQCSIVNNVQFVTIEVVKSLVRMEQYPF